MRLFESVSFVHCHILNQGRGDMEGKGSGPKDTGSRGLSQVLGWFPLLVVGKGHVCGLGASSRGVKRVSVALTPGASASALPRVMFPGKQT